MLDRQSLIIEINQTLNVIIITRGPCEVDSKTCIYGDFIGEATLFVKPLLHIKVSGQKREFLAATHGAAGKHGKLQTRARDVYCMC